MEKVNRLFLFFLLAICPTIALSQVLDNFVSNIKEKAADVIEASKPILKCTQKIKSLKNSDREIDQKLLKLSLSNGSNYNTNGHEIMGIFAEYGEESLEEEEFANFLYSNRFNRESGEDRLASDEGIRGFCQLYDYKKVFRDIASHNENKNKKVSPEQASALSGPSGLISSLFDSLTEENEDKNEGEEERSARKIKILCEKLATNESVTSADVCNQLAGEVVTKPSENAVLSLASVVLNNTDAMFELERDRQTCKECFQKGLKPKKFQKEQMMAAKNIIEKLNEEKLEKELFKLSGAMEMMLKLESIRGKAIVAGAGDDAGAINSLNCRSPQDLEKLIETKCPGKSNEAKELLAKVSPVKLDSTNSIDSLFQNLYNETKYVEDAKCESGVRSIAMNQKMNFMHSSASSTSMNALSRKTLNGLVSILSKDEKIKDSICNGSTPKFAKILGKKVMSAMYSQETSETKEIMKLYLSRYKKNYEITNNVTLDGAQGFEFQKQALISMFKSTIDADPSYNILLHDKDIFCDFAARENDNVDLDSYLNYKNDIETEDEYNKRQYEIAKNYSNNTCKPILENISSLACGESLPDLDNEDSYKNYMRENFSPSDIKEKAKEYLAQNNDVGILYNRENIRVPAVGSLSCELNDQGFTERKEPTHYYTALVNKSYTSDNVSSYLLRTSKKSAKHQKSDRTDKSNVVADSFSEGKGVGSCEDENKEKLYDLYVTRNVLGKESEKAKEIIAREIAQSDGYGGYVPQDISEFIENKKKTNRVGSSNSINKASSASGIVSSSGQVNADESGQSNLLSESVMSQINSSPDYIYDTVEGNSTLSNSDIISSIADDVEDKKDVEKITSSPKEMANYSSWKKDKEESERLLQERINNLTKEIDALKKGDVASNSLDEISTKESEIKALEKSLDKIKNEKYTVNKTQPRNKTNSVAAKSNKVVRDTSVTNNNSEDTVTYSTSNPVGASSYSNSNVGARSVVDNSFKSGQSNYLVLQDASGGVASKFVDMIESDRVDEIEVKYGANGVPMYVKIPGQTLFVAVSELDEDSKKMILDSLSRKEKEEIVAKVTQRDLGRKIASVVDEEKAQLINLKVTTYFNMYEVASSSGDEVLQKFYLNKIKPLDPTLYKILSDKK